MLLAPRAQPSENELLCRVTDLDVTLQGNSILQHFNLEIPRGQCLAICGPNGSGKSTLIRTIIGLNPITRGNITVDGHSIKTSFSRPRALKIMGYVPQRRQDSPTIPATCLEVVRAGLLGPKRIRGRHGDNQRALAALEQVGLVQRAKDAFHTLSGGQQQRVLIARALAGQRQFLVMDEPLAGVDQVSQRSLADTISDLKAQGVTLLLVLHELGPLAKLLDRIISLEGGRVVADQNASQAIAKQTGSAADLPSGPGVDGDSLTTAGRSVGAASWQ